MNDSIFRWISPYCVSPFVRTIDRSIDRGAGGWGDGRKKKKGRNKEKRIEGTMIGFFHLDNLFRTNGIPLKFIRAYYELRMFNFLFFFLFFLVRMKRKKKGTSFPITKISLDTRTRLIMDLQYFISYEWEKKEMKKRSIPTPTPIPTPPTIFRTTIKISLDVHSHVLWPPDVEFLTNEKKKKKYIWKKKKEQTDIPLISHERKYIYSYVLERKSFRWTYKRNKK